MTLARWIFRIAGIYGVATLVPLYFCEARVGREDPPAITHPEYFYGLIGVALAWQIAFLVMSTDPGRYRPLMIPSILEKISFAGACALLYCFGRLSGTTFAVSLGDFVFAVLFTVAFLRTSAGSAA